MHEDKDGCAEVLSLKSPLGTVVPPVQETVLLVQGGVPGDADNGSGQAAPCSVFTCLEPGCGLTFKKASKLRRHRIHHTGEKSYECSVCKSRFTRRGHLKRHAKSHQTKPQRLACPKPGCTVTFLQQNHLNRHIRVCSVGGVVPAGFLCHEPTCEMRFRKAHKLKEHAFLLHGAAAAFECPQPECALTFGTKQLLKKHHRLNHEERYACAVGGCGQTFSRFLDFRKHKATHNEPVACSLCHVNFKNKTALKSHMKTHEDPASRLSFLCEFPGCEQIFCSNNSLKLHQSRKHQGERPFACSDCDARFCHKQSLERHSEKMHSGKPISPRSPSSYQQLARSITGDSKSSPRKKRRRSGANFTDKPSKLQKKLPRPQTAFSDGESTDVIILASETDVTDAEQSQNGRRNRASIQQLALTLSNRSTQGFSHAGHYVISNTNSSDSTESSRLPSAVARTAGATPLDHQSGVCV